MSKIEIVIEGNLCEFKFGRYANSNMTLLAKRKDNGNLARVFTCNLDNVKLEVDQVLIKGYADNEGVLKELQALKVVSGYKKKYSVLNGFAYVCKLLLCRVCQDETEINNLCKKHALEILTEINE
jgi:hypothetical protein